MHYFNVNKKAQLSLTNPRDAKACQKLLKFDVLTTLSLTILAYLHSFSCCCVPNLRNPAKLAENSNLWSSRSSKVIDLGVNRKPMSGHFLSKICQYANERRRREDRGAKGAEGVGVWWGGVPLPSRLGGLGERRKLPQRGPGRSPGRKRICGIL